MDDREGLQLHKARIFLVQHQLKFWLFQLQNAWGEIIAVQQSPQMWCQEPHQWLSWTELHCCSLLEVTAQPCHPPWVAPHRGHPSTHGSPDPWQLLPWAPQESTGWVSYISSCSPQQCLLEVQCSPDTCMWRRWVWTPIALVKAHGLPLALFALSGKHNFIWKTILGGIFSFKM